MDRLLWLYVDCPVYVEIYPNWSRPEPRWALAKRQQEPSPNQAQIWYYSLAQRYKWFTWIGVCLIWNVLILKPPGQTRQTDRRAEEAIPANPSDLPDCWCRELRGSRYCSRIIHHWNRWYRYPDQQRMIPSKQTAPQHQTHSFRRVLQLAPRKHSTNSRYQKSWRWTLQTLTAQCSWLTRSWIGLCSHASPGPSSMWPPSRAWRSHRLPARQSITPTRLHRRDSQTHCGMSYVEPTSEY